MRRILALSMAVLIALIPVQVSAAVASLSGLNIQGQEGISRVLAETDSLNVEVTSSMDVGAQQVRLLYSGRERAFDSCSGGVCTYSSELMDWRAGRHSLQVVLYDQYFIELHRLSDAFFVDAAGPEILFSVSREGNSVTVSYSLKETACEGCGSYASGLAKAELKHGANVLATAELNGTSATGTLQADNLDEGSTELCLHAYDLFGNSNSRCETVFIDTTAPSISGFSLTAAGEPVTHSGALPFNAVASVNVTEENELASVLGDLSALNAVAPELYRWVAARCGKQGAAHVCSWDVKVDGVDGAAAIRINATDKAGNTASITEAVNIALDLGKPVVLSIDSQGTDAEHKYLRLKNNTLIMEIDEPESGMGTADAYLELYSLNSNLANEKAHRCEKDGTWRCYWENMDVAGKQDGATLTARVVSVRDMVGNAWDEDRSVRTQAFVLDTEAPEFINITLSPLGSDLEVLMEGDVVRIVAYIREARSGLSAENVLADYRDFEEVGELSPASSCEADGEIWRCEWEYSGSLVGGKDVKLNVIATDNAGNTRDSAADRVFGGIYVAGLSHQEADYWESILVNEPGMLNRNFLWMSPSGTFVRADMELVPKSSRPYVYGFIVTACEASLGIPGKDVIYEPVSIKAQYYYPQEPRSSKYVIIGLRAYDPDALKNATEVLVRCRGEVIQSRTARGDIFTPNEQVNASYSIGLTKAIFSEPDWALSDKLEEKSSELKKIDSLIKVLDFWVNMLRPFCSLFNLIRQLLSGVCTVINTANVLFLGGAPTGPSNQCFANFKFLDSLWYGNVKDDPATGMKEGFLGSSKSLVSVGFWCDLVLCQDCSMIWKQNVVGRFVDIDKYMGMITWDSLAMKTNGEYPLMTADERARGLGTYRPTVAFSPHNSMIVAAVCMPPCLTGIVSKLKVYREIIITYNVCVNTAAVRGMDTAECDDYWSSQVCQQILGEFWYLIDGFIKDYIAKTALFFFEQRLLHLSECPPGCEVNTACQTGCMGARAYRIVGWFLQLSETIQYIEEIADHQWFSSEESEEKAREHVDEKLEEEE